MNRIKLLVILLITLLLTGCASTNDYYDYAQSYMLSEDEVRLLTERRLGVEIDGMNLDKSSFDNVSDYYRYVASNYASYISDYAKYYGVWIIIFSEALGIILLLLAKRSIQVRKTAVFVFILAIPILTLVLMYGTAFLADWFY